MIYNAKIKAVRSDGRVFNYQSEEWELRKIDGLDFSEIETSKQPRGVGEGDIITGQRRAGREVIIVSRPLDLENFNLLRSQAIAFHNSRYIYNLFIDYLGVKRVVRDCRFTAGKLATGNVYKGKDLTVQFLSPYSDLFATDEVGINFSEKQALWKYPHSFIEGKRLMFATEKAVNDKVISYQGSSATQPVIKITALGYAKNIKIKFGDTAININTELRERDILLIDCSKSYATINDEILPFENVEYFDFRNLKIDFGDTLISVNAEVGGNAIKTEVTYVGRYDGV